MGGFFFFFAGLGIRGMVEQSMEGGGFGWCGHARFVCCATIGTKKKRPRNSFASERVRCFSFFYPFYPIFHLVPPYLLPLTLHPFILAFPLKLTSWRNPFFVFTLSFSKVGVNLGKKRKKTYLFIFIYLYVCVYVWMWGWKEGCVMYDV